MGLNNPVPRSLKSESLKAAKVLASFIKPNQVFGTDHVIPPDILRNAKGLAIITVLKAGFLFSGRVGSGVIVARLPDGSWSAPSAIVTGGAGVGGQIGAEITDFVFILNTKKAVETFAQFGSMTLGGNISLAAGPIGRNAEAAGTASLKSVAAIFSYSKTKGLFAGISLEGSLIFERRDANRKFYGPGCTSKMILSGRVQPPPACEPLMRILDSRAFSTALNFNYNSNGDDDYYNDIPSYSNDSNESSPRNSFRNSARNISTRFSRNSNHSSHRRDYDNYVRNNDNSSDDDFDRYSDDNHRNTHTGHNNNSINNSSKRQTSTSSWEDDVYDRNRSRSSNTENNSTKNNESFYRQPPPPPKQSNSKPGYTATALYTFKGEQDGDLRFKKGDVIHITKKTETTDDWWAGECNGQEGIFPANYVNVE
ncbi:DUF500-domain-containing protein [Ascoidea rubescens DSM 1968]|uniref:DUF500-domain-containing protein n=1 Tax=Ascoidea rubescens DSM 1968 TaxID=1344418 RepID=A0A1D2VI06_9ASCO|nr:DUF500-domain-containing protein [Ascoidea rubescens DSM 1968]ODV61291.1 DUF500-domain-containing protein [Ascoidea rubescens DSM 1968]